MINFGKLEAMPNKVLAKIIDKEEKVLESGIILQGSAVDAAMEDLRKAVVLSSGVDHINVDDKIIYLRFVGTPFAKDYILLDANDILAKEKNELEGF